MIKKTISVASAVAALLVGGVLAAGPAQAVPHDCPRGNFCVWSGPSHTGFWEAFSWNTNLVPGTVYKNDNSSFNNMSSYAMKLHYQPNRTSGSVYACSPAGTLWYQHNPAKQLASLTKVSNC